MTIDVDTLGETFHELPTVDGLGTAGYFGPPIIGVNLDPAVAPALVEAWYVGDMFPCRVTPALAPCLARERRRCRCEAALVASSASASLLHQLESQSCKRQMASTSKDSRPGAHQPCGRPFLNPGAARALIGDLRCHKRAVSKRGKLSPRFRQTKMTRVSPLPTLYFLITIGLGGPNAANGRPSILLLAD
jgi:hypothetical protein